MNTYTTFLMAFALTLAVGISGCSRNNESDASPETSVATTQRSIRVETLVLQPTTFNDVIELTGEVAAFHDAILSAEISGTIEFIAELGYKASAQEQLARMNQSRLYELKQQAEAQEEIARHQFYLAQDNFRRMEPLYKDSIISEQEYQIIKTEYEVTDKALTHAISGNKYAVRQLEQTWLRTPFAGVVEERYVDLGEQVAPGMPVLRVVDNNRMKVTAGVPERYANDIEIGTSVDLNFQAYNTSPMQGKVSFVGSAINADNRTFPIEVTLSNAGGRLKPGMVAQVLVQRETREGAVVVPHAAIIRDELGTTLFVVDRSSGTPVARRRTVALGPSYAGQVVVEDGVTADDEVLVLGQTTVTEGDLLTIVKQYTGLNEKGTLVSENASASM